MMDIVMNLFCNVTSVIQTVVVACLLDAAVFYCVDKICKVYLDQCSQLTEKCRIWFVESVVLVLIAYLIYVFHHLPILLSVFCVGTFLSAFLSGYVDFSQVFHSLCTYWKEFEDQRDTQSIPIVVPQLQPIYTNKVSDEQNKEFLRQSGDIIINDQNTSAKSAIGAGLTSLRYNERTATYEYIGPGAAHHHNSHYPLNKHQKATNHHLRRRPLHQHQADSIATSVSQQQIQNQSGTSMLNSIESISNKVWSVFGLSSSSKLSTLPPGLPNSGSNLCFLNTILQCLAHTPNLPDELAEEVKSCRSEEPAQLTLLDSLSEVLLQLEVVPCEASEPVLNASQFIEACSKLNPDLVSRNSGKQTQQDACEFLNWLLYEVHEAVNDAKSATVSKERMDKDPSMKLLKAVYGNISQAYIDAMKLECRQQISEGKNMMDEAVVEPVQNLANMEWITHKRKNVSVIDECFTFQCIELQMCSRCKKTVANIQNMSILSLPVSADVASSTLTDSIKTFTAKEKLEGRDSLHCDNCQPSSNNDVGLCTPAMGTRAKSIARARSDLTPVSPIAASDMTTSTLVPPQSTDFLSSTPLPGTGKLSTPALIRDVQSSKVLTEGIHQTFLRRLPQCLIIQLLRFNYNPFTKRVFKIHTPIKIEVNGLELSSFTYDSVVEREDMSGIPKVDKYSLYALCLHIGSDRTNSGHYLTYCKAGDNNWYQFDDEKVRKIKDISSEVMRPLVQENCYLLFYTKHQQIS